VVAAWLVLVSVNLVLGLHLDVAVRDLVLALSAFSLSRLAEVHEEGALPARTGHAAAGA
jgi:hypothetical protein